MDSRDMRAKLRSPNVQNARRHLGIATPGVIAAGEPLTEAEIAAIERQFAAFAAFGVAVQTAMGDAARALTDWANSLRSTIDDANSALVGWANALPAEARSEILARAK